MSGIEQIPEDSRLRGYDYTGAVFRYVSVNASGVMKTDIEVEISSGLVMPGMAVLSGLVGVLSGEIHIMSGYVTATISGQPITISGDHVFVESGVYFASGLYVVADIAESGMGVNVQSGYGVIIDSGVGVTIQSGVGVLISGQHVYVESGVYIASGTYVTADIAESGMGVTIQSGAGVVLQSGGAVNLYGYHPASGVWRPLVCDLSGCLAVTWATSGGIWS